MRLREVGPRERRAGLLLRTPQRHPLRLWLGCSGQQACVAVWRVRSGPGSGGWPNRTSRPERRRCRRAGERGAAGRSALPPSLLMAEASSKWRARGSSCCPSLGFRFGASLSTHWGGAEVERRQHEPSVLVVPHLTHLVSPASRGGRAADLILDTISYLFRSLDVIH